MEFGASANQQLSSDDVEASGKRAHRDSGAVCDDCRLDRSRKSRVARGDADRPSEMGRSGRTTGIEPRRGPILLGQDQAELPECDRVILPSAWGSGNSLA